QAGAAAPAPAPTRAPARASTRSTGTGTSIGTGTACYTICVHLCQSVAKSPAASLANSLQPLELSLALHDVLVIPLHLARLRQPAGELGGVDVVGGGVARLGGLEASLL